MGNVQQSQSSHGGEEGLQLDRRLLRTPWVFPYKNTSSLGCPHGTGTFSLGGGLQEHISNPNPPLAQPGSMAAAW